MKIREFEETVKNYIRDTYYKPEFKIKESKQSKELKIQIKLYRLEFIINISIFYGCIKAYTIDTEVNELIENSIQEQIEFWIKK